MTTERQDRILKEHGIVLAHRDVIICAAAVLSQAMEANQLFRVPVIEEAFDKADFDYVDCAMVRAYLKALANISFEGGNDG